MGLPCRAGTLGRAHTIGLTNRPRAFPGAFSLARGLRGGRGHYP